MAASIATRKEEKKEIKLLTKNKNCMKKFFYSVLAAATMLFATTSCSQDEEIVGGGNTPDGKGQKVTFTVGMPEEANSRAIADGVSVGGGNKADNLIWALYEKDKNVCLDFGHVTGTKNTTTGKHEFTAEITMVKGLTYNVLFFAYDDEKCAFELASTPKETDLTALKLKTADLVANEEGYDAFVKCHEFKLGGKTDVELTRPFAQVNAATTVADLDKAKKLQAVVTKSELVINGVPTQYNVLTGETTAKADLTYQANAILTNYQAAADAHPNEDITVKENGVEHTYKYLAMAYVLAGETATSNASTHQATFNFYRGTNGDDLMRTIEIVNLPIQRNWRTNVIGDLLTKEESFKITIDHIFVDDHIIYEDEITNVTTSQDLETALKQDLETIIVNLGEETSSRAEGEKLTFDVNISSTVDSYYFGTAKTNNIIINGNGHTINFIHNDGDWNYIRCANENAKWFINNVTLTNSGKNDGPWNRHDIRFYNPVELKDVISDKAIAVLNDATLKNVKIADTGVYGLWITAEGQTVDVDGLEITTSNDGRGIKIADEYVDTPELVTLNVENSKFTTQSKGAVLVSSKAGAAINWGAGNDISNVAKDNIYAVWVDEDWADSYDLVTVEGAQKRMENSEVLAEGNVLLTDGVYEILNIDGLKWFRDQVNAGANDFSGKTVVLTCDINLNNEAWTPIGLNADAANKFKGTFDGQGHIISNLKVQTEAGYTAAGLFGALNGTAQNFTIDGATIEHISTGAATDNGIAVVAGSLYNTGNVYGVTVKNATVKGNRYVSAIAGYAYGSIMNCTVENITLVATPNKSGESFDNGDKVGAIAGYFDSKSVYQVTGNVAENVTITGYRDMGIIVGTANGADKVSDNTINGANKITVNRDYFYGDKDENANEVVGRITAGTLGENTVNGTVEIIRLTSPSEVNDAIKEGGDYTFEDDVEGAAVSSNAYGKTGLNQLNGGTIDGNGKTLSVSGAYGTWDCALNTTGGTIKNLTVDSGFRGIFINHNSSNCGKVYLENVIIDGPVYTISCDQGTNSGLEATSCTFNGWTSYAATIGDVKFTGCKFGEGAGYAYCRPYAATEFVDCDFEAGFKIDPCATITFKNCKLNGVETECRKFGYSC